MCVAVCPKLCTCSSDDGAGGMMLDCSNAGLNDVPDRIPDDAVDIDLRWNNITLLHNHSFLNCINVKKLDLSCNHQFSLIRNIMLRGMPKLEVIVMTETCLSYKKSSFPDDTFDSLPHLKSISMQSQFEVGLFSLDEFAFVMNKLPHALEELNVDLPRGEGYSRKLTNFTKLRKLGIYSVFFNSNHTFTNDTFEPFKNISLNELTIRVSCLKGVQPLAFYHLPELRSLEISRVRVGISIADFYPALIGLQNTKLERLKLSDFIPQTFNRVFLNDSFCENLVLPHLTDLQIVRTLLYNIKSERDTGCFSGLTNLKRLNLSLNYLTFSLKDSKLYSELQRISIPIELDISHQNEKSHYGEFSIFSKGVLVLRFSPKLTKLDMSSIMNSDNDLPVTLEIGFMPSLEYLIFRNNFVRVLKNVTVFGNTTSASFKIDLSRNSMVSFARSFDHIINNKGFRVVSLLLSENRLGEELGENGQRVFKYFKDVRELDLSLNNIKTLPDLIFKNNAGLEYLYFNKNSLSLINFQISHMRNLQSLDLSENMLSRIDIQFQSQIETIIAFRSKNLTINLLGNPFECSCQTRQFLGWLYQRQSMFSFYENYTCIYNNAPFAFENMTVMLELLDYQCSQNLALKVSASLLAFLIVVIAVSVFLYRHKWDVRFFCLKYVTNRKAYQEFEESEEEYEYDAFVSFHSDDQDWVWNELHENLGRTEDNVETDDHLRFRLCIHERDFVPGGLIEENILRSIESSMKTIVVLSRNFLQSVWCEFELQIARRECIKRGRDLIIAVMLEPLPGDIRISSSVERLIRKNTYIEWPTEELDRIHFWKQMRWALAKKRSE